MDREQILQKFKTLRQWHSKGERAPHKPLLVLYAIGKLLRGEDRFISYVDDIEENLKKLLREFGPRRENYRPDFPFWLLRNDGIWEVTHRDQIRQTASGDAFVTDLKEHKVSGGFHESIHQQLQNDPDLAVEVIHSLLDAHFPDSLHADILQAVGIKLPLQAFKPRTRPSNFQMDILIAYEYRCTVCGFDVKLGGSPVALEASHIKWQRAGGPDEAVNGLALCSLHCKLFDRGVFTLSGRLQILVSEEAHGTTGFQEWLMKFHGKEITLPQRQSYYPKEEYINWHVREVFKGNYREPPTQVVVSKNCLDKENRQLSNVTPTLTQEIGTETAQTPPVEKRDLERTSSPTLETTATEKKDTVPVAPPPDLTADEKTVFTAIDIPSSHIDTIVRTTQLPIGQVSSVLLMLELKGIVQQLPGKQFIKTI